MQGEQVHQEHHPAHATLEVVFAIGMLFSYLASKAQSAELLAADSGNPQRLEVGLTNPGLLPFSCPFRQAPCRNYRLSRSIGYNG